MLSILVCVKRVPDAGRAVFDADGVIDRASAGNIVSRTTSALETALSIRTPAVRASRHQRDLARALYEAAARR